MSAPAELWARLSDAGLTVGDMPQIDDAHTPWYVRVMLGIAGWIAAGFLLGFIGIALAFVVQSAIASIIVGLMVIGGAYAVFLNAPRNDFAAMFALAISFTGQALAIMGLVRLFGDNVMALRAPWFLVALLEAALAFVMPNFIHRVASAYGAGIALAFGLQFSGAPSLSAGLLAAGVAAAWLAESRHAGRHEVLAAIGYGITLAFIQVEAMGLFSRSLAMMFGNRTATGTPWLSEAFVAAVFVVTVVMLVRQAGWSFSGRRTQLALAAVLLLGAVSLKASGIAAGLMIMVLGFANGSRVLCGLGILALLFYASTYYYLLEATLLAKAGVLLASGAMLLALRWLVLRFILREAVHDA